MADNTVADAMSSVRRRRLIFNCDGFGVFHDAQGDYYRWIQNIFGPLEDSQVEALFWCDGAGGNTAYYDSAVLELTGQRLGKVPPFLRRLIDEGRDPPKVIVREARKRGLDVFYSFRINDVHDDFLPDEFPTFKEQHPEWMLGEGYPYGIKTGLNFAIPEVRQLKLAVIQEIVRKYDFDGLEIDFLRSAPYFVPGDEPQYAHVLTDLLREVRRTLRQRGQERGRPIALAVRVDENLDACRLDGFDVATWIRDGLVDIVILGSGAIDIEIEGFKMLAEGTGVLVYPCLYGWPSKYVPLPAELARGLASNYWYQGADGIYLFNWFPHEANKSYLIPLLSEISSPATLRGKPLMFAADRGRPQCEYPHNWLQAALPETLAAREYVNVPLMVGADLSQPMPSVLNLVITCERLTSDDALAVQLNNKLLSVGPSTRSRSGMTIPLRPEEAKRGRNQVNILVTSGGVTVTAVELHVDYGRA